jgi:hypothetical protein
MKPVKINMCGSRYGKWTVLERASDRRWECKCDCGATKSVDGPSLRYGRSTSCGCSIAENKLSATVRKGNHLFACYGCDAKRRGLAFSIEKKDFLKLIAEPCSYCGAVADPFNGLDRKQNSVGYATENVVPCCARCNRMKFQDSPEDFLAHIKKISQHNK